MAPLGRNGDRQTLRTNTGTKPREPTGACGTLRGFCEGCGFFFACGTRRSRREDESEPPSGKERIVDQETRTLEHGKRAPPLSSKPRRDWATFRKQRRDLSSVSFIGCSFRVVLGFFMVLLLVEVCFSRRILGRFPAL